VAQTCVWVFATFPSGGAPLLEKQMFLDYRKQG
jgi:hypothetical protein